jgi:hypothetical protein
MHTPNHHASPRAQGKQVASTERSEPSMPRMHGPPPDWLFPIALSHLSPAGCTLTPIAAGASRLDDRCMVQLAIRCHPRVPVSADELEHWLKQRVHDLRAEAPQATVRLSRLTQGTLGTDLVIGWLVELELAEDEPLLAEHRLADALRDMRLLGLQPALLAPRGAWTNGRAA